MINEMRGYVNGFLPVAQMMREQGATDKEIIAAFNSYSAVESRKEVEKGKEPQRIATALSRKIGEIKQSRQRVDFFQLLCSANYEFRANQRIGKIVVSYIINEILVFEITDEEVQGRREFLEESFFHYMTVSRWDAQNIPEIVMAEIDLLLKNIGAQQEENKRIVKRRVKK